MIPSPVDGSASSNRVNWLPMASQDCLVRQTTFVNPFNTYSKYELSNNNDGFRHGAYIHSEGSSNVPIDYNLQTGAWQGSGKGREIENNNSNAGDDARLHVRTNSSECPGPRQERKSGFLSQMGGNMVRMATLLIRHPVSNLLEFLFPILTVVIAAVLCVHFVYPFSSPYPGADKAYMMNESQSSGVWMNANTAAVRAQDLSSWISRTFYSQVSEKIFEPIPGAEMYPSDKLLFTPITDDTRNLVSRLLKNSLDFWNVYAGIVNSSVAEDVKRSWIFGSIPVWGIVDVDSANPHLSVRISLKSATNQSRAHPEFGPPSVYTPDHPKFQNGITQDVSSSLYIRVYLAYFATIAFCGYFLFAIHVTKRSVLEKELQLREIMIIMGLSQGTQYASWIALYTIECGIMSLIIALLLKFLWLNALNFFCIFSLFFIFSMTLVTYFGFIAEFFNSARLASVVSFFVYVLDLVLISYSESLLMMALSPIALVAKGFVDLFEYQVMGVDTTAYPSALTYEIHFILFLQFLAYVLLMMYICAVLPRKWGVRKSPLFFIVDPIRACCCCRRQAGLNDNQEDGRYPNGVFEPMRDASSYSVWIVGLTKVFRRSGKKLLAVNKLHWALREGEISVLLGHNGAGKTTLMNMLTGMSAISAGDCYVYDRSVRDQLSLVRQGLGYCPQQNILWPNLTCREHLRFYASIRGWSGGEREAIIGDMLTSIDMTEKENYLVKHLSGGQKRKLSVLIAFVAGTRFILLDEPTAGVDALSRRKIWDLARSASSQRTILLSTHFMDEAETLGDSIAIITEGRLRCAGSSVFLKSRLGVNYVLTVPVRPGVDCQPIADLVSSYEPRVNTCKVAAEELTFELPISARRIFPRLLADIENFGEELGVAAGYTMAATTLEQVFVRISQEDYSDAPVKQEEAQVEQRMTQEEAITEASSSVWDVKLLPRRSSIAVSQLTAMLKKRILYTLRYWRIYTFQTILPIAIMLLVVGLSEFYKDKDSDTSSLTELLLLLILLFMPSTFVSSIVRERSCKARHLQKVSGLYFSIYWLSNFVFDLLSYILTIASILVTWVIFDKTLRIAPVDGAFVLLLILYGTSSVAMVYAISFLFKDHSMAQNMVSALFVLSGIILMLVIQIFTHVMKIDVIVKIAGWVFRILPSFCITEDIVFTRILHTEVPSEKKEIKLYTGLCMASETVVFLLITLILDNPHLLRCFSCRWRAGADDHEATLESDVLAERDEVLYSADRSNDPVRVEHLSKVFGNGKVAVRDLTFGVKPGEVFALLGANGAGKTTTISMLCQDLYPTEGSVTICGHDTVTQSPEALECIGYCPQFDATFELLTVEEHLWLYAGVRGIEYAMRHRTVEGLLVLCGLTAYRNVRADKLSGGNRRKLSVALSLVGGPRVVLLDEPSAGLDPMARHGLWLAVEAAASSCAVLLTTHHMEEVEALAHRVAIMAMGELRCIGSKTYLKHKYGSGSQVKIRVEDSNGSQAAVVDFFEQMFPGCNLSEKHDIYYTYDLPAHTKLSLIFRHLEENMDRLRIVDYTVSPKTIEQVFMRVSEDARLPDVD